MKKALLGGVSSVTLSLIATAAFAFDGSGNTAGADNNIVTGGSTQTVIGSGSGNTVSGIFGSENTAVNNTNLGNGGQIAGADNNTASGNTIGSNNSLTADNNLAGNTVDISGNASGNKNITRTDVDINILHDHSKNVDNSADFSDATGFVTGNVLNAQVAATHVDYSPDALTVSGNSLTSTANSAAGIVMSTQAGPNTTLSNTTNAVSVSVGTIN